MDKWGYIKLISKKSDRYGDLLLELMDSVGANNLQEVSFLDAKNFYENLEKD